MKKWIVARIEKLKSEGLESIKSQKAKQIFAIHAGKIAPNYKGYASQRIYNFLSSRDLVTDERPKSNYLSEVIHEDEMIYMPKDIALHFLSLCASKAANIGNRDLIADGDEFTDVVFYNYRALRGDVTTAILQAYLPENFHSLDIQVINEFRTDFAAQRLKFEKEIQSVCKELGDVASEGELANVKERIVELAKDRVEEVKKTYRRSKIEMIVKAFGVSIAPPAILTSVASALSIGIFAPAAIVSAISILVATKLIELDKAKSDKDKSPWSYVLDSGKLKNIH
ncbi:MAG: hypothetical protein WKG06_04900 [Segetibacter sp.]